MDPDHFPIFDEMLICPRLFGYSPCHATGHFCRRSSLPGAPRAGRPAAAPRALNPPSHNSSFTGPPDAEAERDTSIHPRNATMAKDNLIIFDTTMRDGE